MDTVQESYLEWLHDQRNEDIYCMSGRSKQELVAQLLDAGATKAYFAQEELILDVPEDKRKQINQVLLPGVPLI